MTKDSEAAADRKLNGCGWVAITTIGLIVLGIAAAVIFVLFMFGSWIGGQ
jgi:hypothetical protein